MVYVVYSYFSQREGVVVRKAFNEEAQAQAYLESLPKEEDGQKAMNWMAKAELV